MFGGVDRTGLIFKCWLLLYCYFFCCILCILLDGRHLGFLSFVMLQSNEAIFQACLSQLTPAAQAALSSVLST